MSDLPQCLGSKIKSGRLPLREGPVSKLDNIIFLTNLSHIARAVDSVNRLEDGEC